MKSCVAVVLAGGKGSRLEPLTRDRAKPAVPFGGSYRIIDFALSNCLNSGIRRMLVLTQYKAMSLDRHINLGWRRFFCRELGEFIDVVPPQQRIDEHWYQGTADAVYQNIYTIEKERPEYVVILAGDHIYKMNYRTMVEFHRENRADLTIGALRVSPAGARSFGVMQVDTQATRDWLRGKAARTQDDARRSASLPGVDGHLRLHGAVPVRTTLPGRHTQPTAHTTLAGTSSRRSSIRIACSPFRSATRTARQTPTGAMSARWTLTTKPTWIWSSSIRS